MKVEGQHVERRRRKNRGAEGSGAWGEGVPPMGRGLGRGLAPSPEFFLNFLSRYAAFWVQFDALSDTTRPMPNSLQSQPSESSDIIKPASAALGKGCRAF